MQNWRPYSQSFTNAQNRTQDYLDARKDEPSTVKTGVSKQSKKKKQKHDVQSDISEKINQCHLEETKARQYAQCVREEVRKREEEIACHKRQLEAEYIRRQKEYDAELQHEHERILVAEQHVQQKHQQLENEIDIELGIVPPEQQIMSTHPDIDVINVDNTAINIVIPLLNPHSWNLKQWFAIIC